MCLMCIKSDVFGGANPGTRELLHERALKVKRLLDEIAKEDELCDYGDVIIAFLKSEQYELAKQM